MLGEGPIYGIPRSIGSPDKNFNVIFFCIKMLITVIYFLLGKKYLSLKPTIKMLTFQLNFMSDVNVPLSDT